MTKDEVTKMLKILNAEFPLSFRTLDEEGQRIKAKLWYESLKDIPFSIVSQAVTREIIKNPTGFAPTIGQVIDRILDMYTPDEEEASIEAWETVRAFLIKYPQDEYRDHYLELPETVRRVLKIPDLIGLAGNTMEQNQNFEKPRFLKSYKQIRRNQQYKLLEAGKLKLIEDKSNA